MPHKDAPSFVDIYGFEIPKDIKKIVSNMEAQDEESWVRQLGFDGYALSHNRNWHELRNRLECISVEYADCYGSDWEKRIERNIA